ncbi:uncharacterized protein UHOD_08746 [Ustilago sp. UG-2017b]|nr:uncharacterized protein UHOD_08746 [Ustilago sp. UG-2017b]
MSSSTTAHTSVTGATSPPLATPRHPVSSRSQSLLAHQLDLRAQLSHPIIRIATRRYRQLKLTPSESGEIDAVEQLVDADSGVMEAHQSLFKHKKRRKNDRSTTPVADALIRLAAWAAKTNAVRAKCILALLAMAERIRMPHVWTVMALGQLVAISFAFNLFNLGIIYRLDTKDLLASRCNQVHKSKRYVIEPYKEVDFEDSDSSSSDSGSSSASDPHAGHRPGYQVALRTCDLQRVDSRPPSPPRPPSSLPPTQSRSPDPDVPSVVTFSTSYIVKKTPLPPRPTMMDKVAMVLAKVVPERFGLPLYAWPKHMAGTAKDDGRSDGKVPLWEDVKMMYLALGVVSVILRFWVTIACLKEMDGDGGLLQQGWRTATLLFPTTFFRHPAQSSISSDHVCVAISAMFFVLIESGLWIWKAAVATPSAYLAADNSDEEYDNFDNTHSKASPSTISLVDDNSKLIETQARVLVALLLLSPLLGGSATMSFYLAMRCGWVQQCERHKERKDRELLTAPLGSRSRVVEEKEEVKLIENQKRERYVEVRKTEVEFSGMRTARV